MKILLDTHFVLWLPSAHSLLKQREIVLIEEADAVLASAVSVWELHLKWSQFHRSGDRKGPVDPADLLAPLRGAGVEVISLTAPQAAARLDHDIAHRDPFDRLLLVQAQDIGAKLLTRDAKLQSHPLVVQP